MRLSFKRNHNCTTSVMRIMLPVWDGEGWIWPQLEVKASEEPGAGLGLFARVPFSCGTMIPYIGKSTAGSGSYVFHGEDGDPSIDPYRSIGSRGWSVAAMANEPTRKKPRCILFRQCLVVVQAVRPGEELTAYYGAAYTRRHYSLLRNRHLHSLYRLDKRKLASIRQVKAAVEGAQKLRPQA